MTIESKEFYRPIWDDFDGDLFEELVGDLLVAEGFEVERAGIGPDGGIDAFVTEHIKLGYNNPEPFVWAVQCKFTANPKRAISPSDIGSISDTVKDQRFREKNIAGYFLATNGRLSTNLVGRLRGLNKPGLDFKTTWWDRPLLLDILDKHFKVFAKYFQPEPEKPPKLGMPDEQALKEFEELINSSATREAEIQAFLQAHPEFLVSSAAAGTEVFPQVYLEEPDGRVLVPDFLVKRGESPQWVLIELKRPQAKLVTGPSGRRRLTAQVAEAIAQLQYYRDYFESPSNRDTIKRKYGIEVFRPRMVVVVGRDYGDLSSAEIIQIKTRYPEIDILTYEELLKRWGSRDD